MSGKRLMSFCSTVFIMLLAAVFVANAGAQSDSPWIYGIHWYGDHLPSSADNGLVEEMTGGKGIWVLEIILTEDNDGEWGLNHQLDKFREIVVRGHTLIIRIQPRWGVVVPGPGQMETFLAEVRSAAHELADIAHIWQIGNEMNLPWEYQYQMGEALTPALYVQKYKQIRDTIRSVPSSLGPQIVLLGPVAPLAEDYLKGMLRELGPDDVDGFAMHAYGGAHGSFMRDVALQAEWIDEFHDKGFDRKPIYITEWGAKVTGLNDTDEKAVSNFLLESFKALRNYNDPVQNPGHHPIVTAIWFVYKRDSQWREWSILDLHDVNPPGIGLDLYDTFQGACNLDIPAGDDFGDVGSDDLLIHRSPSLLVAETVAGDNAANGTFNVFKSGPGSLTYDLVTNVGWLSVTPSTGTTAGEVDTITVTYDTLGLSPGEYRAAITISDPSAANHPQSVAVHLTVRAFAPEPTIVNPDFEDDYPRAFSVATGWSSFGGNKWERVYDPERRWTQGVTDIPPGGEGGVFQTISVSPGTRYRVSTYAQAQTRDYDVSIGVDPAGSGNADAAAFGTPSSSGSWAETTHEFSATGSSATLFLRARNKTGYWIYGKWSLFDGVRIETIGSSTNIPPEVSITSPADGATYTAPADITVSADALDTDGTVTKVEFLSGSALLGEDANSPYSFTMSQASSGSYTFTARATDDQGAVTTSHPVHITVEGTPLPTGKSKLSIHTGFTGPLSMAFIREAKPRIVKILDSFGQASEIKQVSPDTQIIGRIFLGSQPMDGNATQRAEEWWDLTRNLILQYPAVDYWEGYNEPIIHSEELMRWYASFEAARVELLAQNGLKACIGNFSTGNPDLALWPAFFPAIDQALSRGGILGLHEYGTPMQQWYESDVGEGWLCGRYRKVYRQHLIPTDRVIHLAITETGVDVIAPVGWKNHFTGEEYFEQLVWYDSLLLQDAFVLGATIFSLEIPNWFDFDIAPIMDLVTEHVQNGTFNQPPTVSITSPANGENFTAPATIDLTADAFDTDGTVSRVEFFHGGEKLGEDLSAPYSHTWIGVSAGTYTLIAKATDDQGAVATSAGVSVTVGTLPTARLIVNGDFSQGLSHWSTWRERGTLNPAVNGSGQLHLAAIGHNGGVYQTFATGGAGTEIAIDGFWASSPTASLQWSEVLIINGGAPPVDGRDLTADGENVLLIYKNDSAAGWSGLMRQETTVSSSGTFVAAGDTATIVLKSGNLPGVNSGTLFDNIVVRRVP